MNYKKCLIVVVVVAALTVAAWFNINPFKITDPRNSRFEASEFRFGDTYSPFDTAEAFSVMFPLGTPREYVEEILVKGANASSWEDPNFEKPSFAYKLVKYKEPLTFPPKSIKKGPTHNFYYTKDGERLINIKPSQMNWVFKNMPDFRGFGKLDEKSLNELIDQARAEHP